MFDVGWLVIVWVIWIALAAIVLLLVRFTMRGQQEIASEQESEITAWQVSHGNAQGSGADRPAQAGVGPPLSAT
jgi:hypothetical protein